MNEEDKVPEPVEVGQVYFWRGSCFVVQVDPYTQQLQWYRDTEVSNARR